MDTIVNEQRRTAFRPQSPAQLALRQLVRDKAAMLALAALSILIALATFAPSIAPYDPVQMFPNETLGAPSRVHLMGTDLIGRDVLSRVIFGGRISLAVGFVSVSISLSVGVVLGLLAGYFGRAVDTVIMRLMDMMLAFPGILLALAIVSFLGPGLFNVMIAVGVSGIPSFARLVRGSVLSVKECLYFEAARSIGNKDGRIMFRHVLPNVMAPILVLATLAYGWAILNAASLGFLGLGAQPPTPEWGLMLSDGRSFLSDAPWISVLPGLAIMMSVLSANVLGDALRDALDPRLRL